MFQEEWESQNQWGHVSRTLILITFMFQELLLIAEKEEWESQNQWGHISVPFMWASFNWVRIREEEVNWIEIEMKLGFRKGLGSWFLCEIFSE